MCSYYFFELAPDETSLIGYELGYCERNRCQRPDGLEILESFTSLTSLNKKLDVSGVGVVNLEGMLLC